MTTETNAYKLALEAKRVLSRKGVPADGRFLIASPEYLEVLMLDEHFIKQGDLAQALVQQAHIDEEQARVVAHAAGGNFMRAMAGITVDVATASMRPCAEARTTMWCSTPT